MRLWIQNISGVIDVKGQIPLSLFNLLETTESLK